MFKIVASDLLASAAVIFLGVCAARVFVNKFTAVCNDELEKKKSTYTNLAARFRHIESERASLDEEILNIGRLYDISKKMSQSLKFEDIFLILSQFLKEHFSFLKVDLILLNSEKHGSAKEKSLLKVVYEVDKNGNANKVPGEKLSRYSKTVEIASADKGAVFEDAGSNTIVPLVVEHKVIAVLAAAGLEKKDFDRFLILASQFALQIKKVVLYERVQELSITDGLTGAYRRRYFTTRLREELERANRLKLECTFLIIDIDHFKNCNDTFGHLVGDAALREIASMVKKNIREVDLLARFGGEEFSVILPETSLEGALHVAERIRKAICDRKIKAYDEILNLTVSIGISSYPKDSTEADDLIDKADQALYRAKESGRNRVVSYRQ